MSVIFEKFSDINPDDCSNYEERVCLTFDIDWASDEVLEDAINLVESADVAATWFVTHETVLLNRLRENPMFELGIHPNFNDLLSGRIVNGSSAEIILDRMMEIVPEAKSVRSHSIVQSSRLLELFVRKGLTHEGNDFIPERAGIELKPWRLWNGLIKVPYFWSDEIVYLWPGGHPLDLILSRKGLKVFDFHPIHVFLNTENLERYEITRQFHSKAEQLINYRSEDPLGARSMLIDLIKP